MSKIKKMASYHLDGKHFIDREVWNSIVKANIYCPGIARVIYNLKTEDKVRRKGEDGKETVESVRLEKPILATTVFFADGSVVTVKNSNEDEIATTVEELPDGTNVEVATKSAKEAGLVYAIVKRVFGYVGKEKAPGAGGLGRRLAEIVAEAEDQNVSAAKRKAEAKARKGKSQEPKPPKQKRESLKSVMRRLAPFAAAVVDELSSDPDAFAKRIRDLLGKA